jgi:hypothetical protein
VARISPIAQHPFFDVSPEQIAALGDEDLRLLIARLCEADLRRRGLPTSAILYGGNQIAADGGIDVRVELPADTRIDGFIPRPTTGFQAKADDMPAREIAKEMCPEAKQADGTKVRSLRPSIRDLAARGGAYVIAGSKGSTTDSRLLERCDAMRAAVADLPGSDALHLLLLRPYPHGHLAERLSGGGAVGTGQDRPTVGRLAAPGELVLRPGGTRWRLSERRHRPA